MDRVVQVLSVGYDRHLMLSRSLLLRNSGYEVTEAYSRHQALAFARSDATDLLLICHTVPENEQRALISAVHKQRLPIPILCMSESDFLPAPLEGSIMVSNTPAELLAEIDSALRQKMAARRH